MPAPTGSLIAETPAVRIYSRQPDGFHASGKSPCRNAASTTATPFLDSSAHALVMVHSIVDRHAYRFGPWRSSRPQEQGPPVAGQCGCAREFFAPAAPR